MPNPLNQKLTSYWIIARSLWVTLKYSVICLYYSYRGSREDIDRSVHRWADALLRIVQADVQVHNPHNVQLDKNVPTVLMSNHGSLYDIPLIFVAFPRTSIRMIAKKELFRVPVWGHAMKACEFLAIDRENSQQALKDMEMVRAKMQDGIVPWVAPEGTRSRDGQLGVFKKGGFMLAIQTQATIVPITIRGAADILPAKSLQFGIGRKIDIVIGQPVDASQYTVQTRMTLLNAVREQIANTFI
jgi:1-acyl-sn-glycerol-3-phosphate acyltransferase